MVRRGIIGRTVQTAARTAVIAGTATAVSGKVAAAQAGKAAAAAGAAPVAPPPAAASGGMSDEAIGKLSKLAELHKAGVLTDEEFATQKARLLA